MKKIFTVGVVALLLVGALVGCTKGENATSGEETVLNETEKSEQINDKYVTLGKIINFGKDSVHVLTGDIAQVFKVNEEKIKDFYLGETVGVKEIGNEEFELEAYKDTDFTIRHTTMGHMISTVSGKIKEVNDKKFIIHTKDGDMEFEANDKLLLEEGTDVTVEYFEFKPGSGEKTFADIYDETSKINLIVKNIRRAEDGMMVLDTEDESGVKYEVNVSSVLNFNHSDLKENDKLTVYPAIIKESSPAQIDAKMIKKQ